jgi:hypothetical protein
VALGVVPTRANFMSLLGKGQSDEATVLQHMASYLQSFTAVLTQINTFYDANKLDS